MLQRARLTAPFTQEVKERLVLLRQGGGETGKPHIMEGEHEEYG